MVRHPQTPEIGRVRVNYAVTQENSPVLDLKARWHALRVEDPSIRPRDAAGRLGVTEAELVAARCGDGVQRLDGPWGDLIQDLPGLGIVMALTRNESAVHEKVGRFGRISIFQNMGLVLNEDIDLRIFLNHWHSGFAVSDETRGGVRRSLQFFDVDGTAVHKVYLRAESDHEAFEALVDKYLHADQSAGQRILPKAKPPADRPDTEIDRVTLRDRWLALQDVHDFHAMLQELGAGRVQAFRLVGDDIAWPVNKDSFRMALKQAAATETPVMIFTGSPGVIQIHTGPVRKLKEVGPWYNVLDPGFNLHLRQDQIASAWVIKKPTRDGVVTSLEIFDADNQQIAWMFGKRKPGEPEREDWRALVNALEPDGEHVR
ncbi:MAG: hemin-degrading factor [Alphaproteobacteria bacterium]|nr:MAG: hemin-degrading factor [Alphaproteobacteria bacterium]